MAVVCHLHLRVEDVDRGVDNGGSVAVGDDLEQLAGGVGDNGHEVEAQLTRLQVEDEVVGVAALLAGLQEGVLGALEADSGQVDDDVRGGGHALGERPGVDEGAAEDGDADGGVLVVGDLDDGLGGAAVDQLKAEDVGLGELGVDIDLDLGRGLGQGLLGSLLAEKSLVSKMRANDG